VLLFKFLMVAGEALCLTGRQLVSHFPLDNTVEEICLGWDDEIAALPAFLLQLELKALTLETSNWRMAGVNIRHLPKKKLIGKPLK
jgi:hypothetical protein